MNKSTLKGFEVGSVFGRLRLIEQRPSWKRYNDKGFVRSTRPRVLVECLCGSPPFECGWEEVKNGNTRSCGCQRTETIKRVKTTHGLSRNIVFIRFLSMVARCENPKSTKYKDYGARGISVYQGWKNDPQSYVDYILSLNPDSEKLMKQGYEVDRIDNNGNYEPGNIRLVTKIVNCNNTRSNVYIDVFDESITVANAVRKYGEPSGINRNTFGSRCSAGWDIERALISPIVKGKRKPPNFASPLSVEEREAVSSRYNNP